MTTVLQRVTHASVTVSNATISSISHRLCVLVGIASDDTIEDAEWMVRKVLGVHQQRTVTATNDSMTLTSGDTSNERRHQQLMMTPATNDDTSNKQRQQRMMV
jgi:D-aminoacyl-tRNA deacylase